MYTCAMCHKHSCKTGNMEDAPENCPCREGEKQEEIKSLYNDEENKNIAYHSALVESEGYCKKTRLQEIMDFADKCGYKKLRVAFCIGLERHANLKYKYGNRTFWCRGYFVDTAGKNDKAIAEYMKIS